MASYQVDLIADGREALHRTVYSLEDLSYMYKYIVDGHHKPINCTAIQKTTLVSLQES